MSIGPAADEFGDFEQASLPQRRSFSFGLFLSVVTVAAVLFLTASLALTCMQGFRVNSSDNLILGSWRSAAHPHFSTITFGKGGHFTAKDKTQTFHGTYRFLAQYTIEFHFLEQREHFYHWKVEFRQGEMIATDSSDGTSWHWSRLRED
jgi:hypothetical protein